MANIADVASAAAARNQLKERNSLSIALSPDTSTEKQSHGIPEPSSQQTETAEAAAVGEAEDQYAVFEVHGKTVKVRRKAFGALCTEFMYTI